MFELPQPPPLEELHDPLFDEKGVSVWIKREDLIHREISGNKWRKLKYNFIEAKNLGFSKIMTFGGAYSNHIAATAAAARDYGFESIGIIRGDELNPGSNPTLEKAHQDGMNLIFVSREQYRKRDNPEWIKTLMTEHQAYMVPEGGSNSLAVKGVREMISDIDQKFDYVFCAVGTGGTLAGISSGLSENQMALGFSVLKGLDQLEDDVEKLGGNPKNFKINHDYHFDGYGKFDKKLIGFIRRFYPLFQIPLDPIYTGKMMYGLFDLIKMGYFPKGSTLIAIHTGGLQGIVGFSQTHGLNLPYE